MGQVVTEKDLAKGSVVWIKRCRCVILEVHPITGLRVFRKDGSDKERTLTFHETQILVRKWDIVPDRIRQEMPAPVAGMLDTEWMHYDPEVRDRADVRAAICRKLDRLDPVKRRQEVIEGAIAEVAEALGSKVLMPSLQSVRRRWDPLWIASSKNKLALLDKEHCRGNRRPFDNDAYRPVIDLAEGLITECITSRVTKKESLSTVQGLTDALVLLGLENRDWKDNEFVQNLKRNLGEAFDSHPIPKLLDKIFRTGKFRLHPCIDKHERRIGANLIRNRFKRRNVYEQVSYRVNRKEARRLASGIEKGPIVDLPLQRVEADSSVVDRLIVKKDGKGQRMEITFIKDKCSGAITGMHHSLEKSNWFTLHQAISMSVLPKDDYLSSFNYKFVNDWPIWGSADELVLDRHATHRGAALAGMSAKIGFTIVDMPAARGDQKGGIEKTIGDFMHNHVVSQPGYVGHNTTARDPEKALAECSEEQAIEAAVAYVVDYYNQQIEPETGEIRIHRFKRLMDNALAWKAPPDPDLFPGKASTATLTAKGIQIKGLLYRSPELTQMYFDAGGNVGVVIFIPRYKQDVIHVGELRGRGNVDAYLQGACAGLGLTHDQALAKHRERKRSKVTKEQKDKAAHGLINQYMSNDISRGPPRREKKMASAPSKPGHHIAIPPVNTSVSKSPEFRGHDMDDKHEIETYRQRGGAYAVPGPASRAVNKSIEAANLAQLEVPALPVGPGFMPNGPDTTETIPVSVALASENSAPVRDQGTKPPNPATRSALPALPKGPFKF